jgi:hypothetical protein
MEAESSGRHCQAPGNIAGAPGSPRAGNGCLLAWPTGSKSLCRCDSVVAIKPPAVETAGAGGQVSNDQGQDRRGHSDRRSASDAWSLPTLLDGASHSVRGRAGTGLKPGTDRPTPQRRRTHCRHVAGRTMGRCSVGGARGTKAGSGKPHQGCCGLLRGRRTLRRFGQTLGPGALPAPHERCHA